LKSTVLIGAMLAATAHSAIAQPQTKAESAGCFISETAYYRQRLIHDLRLDPSHSLDQLAQSNPLYGDMLKTIAESISQKCSVTEKQLNASAQ
jgi:hypothetical protein